MCLYFSPDEASSWDQSGSTCGHASERSLHRAVIEVRSRVQRSQYPGEDSRIQGKTFARSQQRFAGKRIGFATHWHAYTNVPTMRGSENRLMIACCNRCSVTKNSGRDQSAVSLHCTYSSSRHAHLKEVASRKGYASRSGYRLTVMPRAVLGTFKNKIHFRLSTIAVN